jgi:hypothetical protein
VDRALARLPAEAPRPLVILDPDQPRGRSEGLRQLMLRNAFAHHLFALGNVPVVLAIGLDAGGRAPARRALVETLAAGGSAADACREVSLASNDAWLLGAAVWSQLAAFAMPRTWVNP